MVIEKVESIQKKCCLAGSKNTGTRMAEKENRVFDPRMGGRRGRQKAEEMNREEGGERQEEEKQAGNQRNDVETGMAGGDRAARA